MPAFLVGRNFAATREETGVCFSIREEELLTAIEDLAFGG
jgi:hypothetical protein